MPGGDGQGERAGDRLDVSANVLAEPQPDRAYMEICKKKMFVFKVSQDSKRV